jgi:hypothetical protein
MISVTGGTSAVDTTVLFLSAWYAIRDIASDILWTLRKLDSLPYKCALHWVQKQKGERER